MNILIAGAGKVGKTLCDELSDEGHDITIIDSNAKVLEDVISKYDVISLNGNSASKATLEEANIKNMDVFVAATNLDEVNLLSCITAQALNPTLATVARIRDPEYIDQAHEMRDTFSLNYVVNPEKQAANEIARLLKYPGFLQREYFAKARAEVVELKIKEDSPLKNVNLINLENSIHAKVLVCAVLRDGVPYIPHGDFVLETGDKIFITGESQELHSMLKNIGVISEPVKHVIIAGGGRISYYLANDLHESGINTSIIEADEEICESLSSKLPFATIIHGDVSDQSVLDNEEIDEYDALVSLTGMDELNIVTSLYASAKGVREIVTKLGRGGEGALLDSMPIGAVVCPKELCTVNIVRYLRALENSKGAAISIHRIADGLVEAVEFVVDETTKNIGVPLKDIKTKEDILIATIRKGRDFIIASGDATFEEGDTMIVICKRNSGTNKINDIFED